MIEIQVDVHTITVEPEKNLVCLYVVGLFEEKVYKKFQTEVLDAVESLARGQKKVDIITDLRKAHPQPRGIADDNDWKVRLYPNVRRNALIVNSVIYKMQLERSHKTPKLRYYDNMKDALNWLAEV